MNAAIFAVTFLAFLIQNDPEGFEDTVETKTVGELRTSYDFIIVGGGSSGSALANRLSEVSDWNILLIEAGGQETAFSKTPGMYYALPQSRYDWNYTTTRQKLACRALNGRCLYPRGRALGGSSAINAMIYTRGYKSDYDRWEKAGNCGWGYKNLEPYFRAIRGSKDEEGTLGASYTPPAGIRKNFIEAGLELGMQRGGCEDLEEDCVQVNENTIRDGERCSASVAYLEGLQRRNLDIITEAQVLKVIIDRKKATGVVFKKNGIDKEVTASREVVLSAGAIDTPKLLMLSGIGPKQHLTNLGINVVANLPVGDNLQDHNRVPLWFSVSSGTVNFAKVPMNETFEDYLTERLGSLSTNGVEALGFARLGLLRRLDSPNVQFHMNSLSMNDQENLTAVTATVLRPRSRGTVRLRSTDPLDAPLIDPKYYSNPSDAALTVSGLRFISKLFKTSALGRLSPRLYKNNHPYCIQTRTNVGYFTCVIEYYTMTNYHPVGTAKMDRRNGVVDDRLMVRGIENLRVVDASIAPTIISANTNVMAVMIGEKGGDLIKQSYNKPTRVTMPICKAK